MDLISSSCENCRFRTDPVSTAREFSLGCSHPSYAELFAGFPSDWPCLEFLKGFRKLSEWSTAHNFRKLSGEKEPRFSGTRLDSFLENEICDLWEPEERENVPEKYSFLKKRVDPGNCGEHDRDNSFLREEGFRKQFELWKSENPGSVPVGICRESGLKVSGQEFVCFVFEDPEGRRYFTHVPVSWIEEAS